MTIDRNESAIYTLLGFQDFHGEVPGKAQQEADHADVDLGPGSNRVLVDVGHEEPEGLPQTVVGESRLCVVREERSVQS